MLAELANRSRASPPASSNQRLRWSFQVYNLEARSNQHTRIRAMPALRIVKHTPPCNKHSSLLIAVDDMLLLVGVGRWTAGNCFVATVVND